MNRSFDHIIGFDWDHGNLTKNLKKHGVASGESEQVFFNAPLVMIEDEGHSSEEKRLAVFGQTDQGRKLTVVFTLRHNRIRVISARDMHRKERKFYEEQSRKQDEGAS
jgi:uncharacterized DUF497 family protein